MSQHSDSDNTSEPSLYIDDDSYDDNANQHLPDDDDEPTEEFRRPSEEGLRRLKELYANAADNALDSTDGCFTDVGLKIIKGVIGVLLNHLVNNKIKQECLGCEINHPSQRRHSCLYEPPSYFFDAHFGEFADKLFQPILHPIVNYALQRSGLKADPRAIQGAAGAILHELKDEPNIISKLEEISENLQGDDTDALIFDIVDFWKTNAVKE